MLLLNQRISIIVAVVEIIFVGIKYLKWGVFSIYLVRYIVTHIFILNEHFAVGIVIRCDINSAVCENSLQMGLVDAVRFVSYFNVVYLTGLILMWSVHDMNTVVNDEELCISLWVLYCCWVFYDRNSFFHNFPAVYH